MTPSESRELAAAVLDRLAPRLPEAAASDAEASGTPIRRLHRLVADRLNALGEQDALAELVRNPRNDSLVRRLLATAATDDPTYAEELAAALEALPVAGTPVTAPSAAEEVPPTADGARPRRYGPWVAVVTVVILLLLGVFVARTVVHGLDGAGGLTADSGCEEYRQAPPEERVAAIRQIGLAKGISGVDSPLVMTAVDQLCKTQPSAKLGDLIARFGG
ncbi:hypothetical protein I0C86_26060 [Plantactinospora sp. S1510]|uniref:Uncharacterized protein n=1 Tax=Plantactinospora alkalitolerans TaxID=2789879 RepID=A0ABS0H2M4_9ACTN|nr:hypothetical protein [Plantactinospora alkalitolerans]MBF9132387.1 hypothetical protein [Plantactinospora alkalitolerans]